MNKKNKISIATALVAIHLALFFFLLRPPKKDKEPTVSRQPLPAHTMKEQTTGNNPLHDFNLKKLTIPKLPETSDGSTPPTTRKETPPAIPRNEPTKQSSSIAPPKNQTGYLRNDLPVRRTKKIFSKLVKDPYRGAIVIDAHSSKILFEENAEAYAYPASVTKLMTMLLVLDHIEQGKTRLNAPVKVTKEVCNVGGSQVYLDQRETFSVNDMLKALMIHSANDAATALAIHVAGSTEAFVALMNKKANELGMNATTYHSPHGLPPGAEKQPDISTPHDIALLALAVLKHSATLTYTGTSLAYLPTNNIRKERFMLSNRNALVKSTGYKGCDGLKTGYHSIGGWSITATAERNGKRIIAVLLGCPSKASRNERTKELLDKGFNALNKK